MDPLTLAASALLGGVFGFAAIAKLTAPSARRDVAALLEQASLARAPLAAGLAWTVAVAELAVPVLLCVPGASPAGLVLAAALASGFVAVISTALRRGVRVPCACFGSRGAVIGPLHVVRSAALAAVAGVALVAPEGAPADGPTLVATAAVSLLAAAAIVVIDDALTLLTEPDHPLGRNRS